jgi:hypothetical protein
MEHEYSITLNFTTDRVLTIDEFHALQGACLSQVDDPAGLNGEKRASFTVIEADIEWDGMAAESLDEEE